MHDQFRRAKRKMGEHSHTRTTTKRTEQSLVFAVNGESFELFQVDPSTTLLEFLRSRTSFKSPKLGCGAGLSSSFLLETFIDYGC